MNMKFLCYVITILIGTLSVVQATDQQPSTCDPCLQAISFGSDKFFNWITSPQCTVSVRYQTRQCGSCQDIRIMNITVSGLCNDSAGIHKVDYEYVLGLLVEDINNTADTIGYARCLRLIRPRCWKQPCVVISSSGGGPSSFEGRDSIYCSPDCCVSRIILTSDGKGCVDMYDGNTNLDVDMNEARRYYNSHQFDEQYDPNNPCPSSGGSCQCEAVDTCSPDFVKKFKEKKLGLGRNH